MFLMSTVTTSAQNLLIESFDSLEQLHQDILPYVGKEVFLEREYLLAIEKAAPQGMSFRYVRVRDEAHNSGFFYFQIINLSSRDLGRIIHFEPYGKLLNSITGILDTFIFGVNKDKDHYLLICGNMCLSGDYGIRIPDSTFAKEAPALLCRAMDEVSRELEKKGKVVAWVVKDFERRHNVFDKKLAGRRFIRLSMDPVMKMEIRAHWNTMDDYVNDLSSKYRIRYKQTRKKMDGITLREMTVEDMDRYRSRIDELYRNVQFKSPVRLLKPDARYLRGMKINMGQRCTILGFFAGEELIAFQCGVADYTHYEAHHIGLDYHYNKSLALYLNILFNYIQLAIEAGSPLLSFGRTALEMKTTVGAIPVMYDTYLKFSNRIVNSVCRALAPTKAGQEWVPRNPFKQEVDQT